jgi:hypothetical protein
MKTMLSQTEAWRRVVKRVLGEQVYAVLQMLVDKELKAMAEEPERGTAAVKE